MSGERRSVMAEGVGGGVPFGTQIHRMAQARQDDVGLLFCSEAGIERAVTWRELDDRSTQVARVLSEQGLDVGERVAIALRNSPEHLIAVFAGWKLGAVVVPMRWDLPEWERRRVLEAMSPKLVIGQHGIDPFQGSDDLSTDPLPESTPPHSWGICSSGSTGTPKVILIKNPGLYVDGMSASTIVEAYGALPSPQRVIVPAPLYHSNGFTATRNLMSGVMTVLMERFNAEQMLTLMERHRVTGFYGASPMLQRLVQVEGIESRDLTSLDWVQQGASPLPMWVGHRWCELIGPERLYLSYGASERHGLVSCRGDEWLAHPGTLGRAYADTEIAILDEEGKELPPGSIGSIYLRKPGGPEASYLGDNVMPMVSTKDGFLTVGDMGWLDEDRFLYMADRRVDMIVTGAVNVFPAEVESALSEHPAIADVVVVGLKDPGWGRRVHAIVQPANWANPPSASDVTAFAKSRLAPYKVPKSVEFMEAIPRNDAMKLNRAALVEERDGVEANRAGDANAPHTT